MHPGVTNVDMALVVTVFVFLAGVIFAGGRISARVDQLERGREELRDDIKELRDDVRAIKRAVHGDAG